MSENKQDLLPCPFCGEGDPLIHHIEAHSHPISGLPDFEGSVTIECRGCDLGFIKPTEAEAIAQWNRRADSEQVKELQILDAARQAARKRWGKLSPFRVGVKVGEMGVKVRNPYKEGSRGAHSFDEGVQFGTERRKSNQEES